MEHLLGCLLRAITHCSPAQACQARGAKQQAFRARPGKVGPTCLGLTLIQRAILRGAARLTEHLYFIFLECPLCLPRTCFHSIRYTVGGYKTKQNASDIAWGSPSIGL